MSRPPALARQKRIGAVLVDHDGARWRKVRRLDPDAYRDAVLDAAASARVVGRVTVDELVRLGWERVPQN